MGDAGDLISWPWQSRVIRNAVDVQLGGVSTTGQKAKGSRSHQQLLEKLHLGSHTKRKVPARHASGLTLWARNHGVGKSKPRVVYVSVKTIHPGANEARC
ncbi:MAG: hypothetical protein CM15mP39_05510 [Synechococcus sp.]|nr:MAG: hypothetical protein CM15mP39_05510 [Synechococcus sp.]